MPIDKQRNLIFVHIPKCAGTSIEKALGIYGKPECWHGVGLPQHWTLNKIVERYGEQILDDNFVFAFVRNPWDRIVSEFNYLHKISDPAVRGRGFPWFVENVVDGKTSCSQHVAVHLRPQSDFLANYEDKVDFIGRFENLQKDWVELGERLGKSLPKLGHENKSPHFGIDHRSSYNETTKQIVQDIYQNDIKFFDYSF